MEAILKILLGTFFNYSSKLSPSITAKIAWSFFCKPRISKKPLSNFESQLRQQCTQSIIQNGEYNICVYEWRNANNIDSAKTVLLSHGWGGHALNFSRLISTLITNGFNVVAYDSPAHGNSSGRQTNLLRNTHALLAVAKQKQNIHALIGHSFGTMASTYAIDICHSEISCSQLAHVEKLILIAGPNKLLDIFSSFTQAMQLPESVLIIFQEKVEQLTQRKMQDMTAATFLQSHAGKTLIIHDHDDRIVPFTEAQSVADSNNAELFTTSGCGHFRILKAKNVIDKIVNFLH